MPKIDLVNVTHTYKNRKDSQTSLKNVTTSFPTNKINIILGESGGGKTTILRCILGLENYEGSILMDGSDISIFQVNQRNFSYINQDIVLYPHMTLFNNIAYPLTLKKIDKDEIRRRVFDIAEEFGIKDLLFRKPRELSFGQCQRAAIARALVKRPDLILLDEPFSNLDEDNAHNIGNFVRDYLKSHGITAIFVTHNSKEALRLADTITIIEQGHILISGDPLEVFKNSDPIIHKYFKDE